MAQEIELKLLLPAEWHSSVGSLTLLKALAPTRQQLITTYFDTPEQLLASQRQTLRLRQIDGQYWQTLKGGGKSQAGLSERNEIELPLTQAALDLTAFPDADFQRWQQAEHLSQRLIPQFTTDFERLSWQLCYGQSQIELALDLGQIRAAGQHRPISEIELELKQGQASDLQALAQHLSQELPLCPGLVSKAGRGYRLVRHEPELLPNPPLDQPQALQQALLTGLAPWFADLWLDSDPELLVKWLLALSHLQSDARRRQQYAELAQELDSCQAEAEWRHWRNNPALGQLLLQS